VNIRWNATEIGFTLRDSGSRMLLVDDSYVPLVPRLRAECPEISAYLSMGEGPHPRPCSTTKTSLPHLAQ
jgi:hypothetical protein